YFPHFQSLFIPQMYTYNTLNLLHNHPSPRFLHSFPTRRSSDLSTRISHSSLLTRSRTGELLTCLRLALMAGNDTSGSMKIDIHRSEEHTSELQSQSNLVCRLLLEKKKCKQCKTKGRTQLLT